MSSTINEPFRFNQTVSFGGGINVGEDAAADLLEILQRNLQQFAIPFTAFRVWDNLASLLPNAAATDDLGIVPTTFGTDAPRLNSGDVKAAGTVTRYARALIQLPAEYVAGETVTIRVRAGMKTTVAATSCTVDIEAYRADEDGAISADLCTTAAQSMNSLTFADKDFAITPTTLTPGNFLDVRVTVVSVDAATATAVIPTISAFKLLCDTRA